MTDIEREVADFIKKHGDLTEVYRLARARYDFAVVLAEHAPGPVERARALTKIAIILEWLKDDLVASRQFGQAIEVRSQLGRILARFGKVLREAQAQEKHDDR